MDVRLRRSVWFSRSVVLSLRCEPESPAGLVKLQMWAPLPRVSDEVGRSGFRPVICISHKFPGHAGPAGLGTAV